MYAWILIKILPLLIIIIDLKCALSIPRMRYRTYRSKGPPPFPSILQYSPPRQTSAPNFQNEYVTPPFLMNSPPKSSYDQPPNSSYDQLPVMDYDSPNNGIQMEYGPPTTTDSKPLVHKHIYVHIPPPEPDTPVMRPPLTTVAPQKHYRIVFIKAPTEAPVTYPTIPLQPPDEEKTLVYVLVKKPDPLPELILPKPATTIPTKPEVYFIRYKTQKDENVGPYPPSISNQSTNNYPSNNNNYPPNNNNYPPNSSYGPPQNPFSSSNSFQTTSPTLGPPLAAYMNYSKPLKTSKNNSFVRK